MPRRLGGKESRGKPGRPPAHWAPFIAAELKLSGPTIGRESRQWVSDGYSWMTLIIVVVPVVLVRLIGLIPILLVRRFIASVTPVS